MSCPYWYLVTNPLGAVGLYAEFVEKDSVRHSDSEGAVAVGGDAYFGDPAKPSGFSVGSRLTPTTPAPSATPEGDLATTGSSVGPGVIGAGAVAVLAGGALLAFAKRRRRAS
ncbi:collagen-binding domain-containing protein [Streptomyces cinereoruber]|uniref:collagen-binding domain-containing protein n=1 Tax=Streptomyces cinereoruber TaxID=67260 RepID=UPI003C2C6B57